LRFAECSSTNLDLVFVVDGSRRFDRAGWSWILSFVSNVVRGYQISRTGVRVALVQYSDRATTSIPLGQYNDANSFGSAVSQIRQLQGTSNVATGLDQARLVLSGSGSRSKVVIAVTDQFQGSSTISTAAANVVNSGILVVGIGVSGAIGLTLDSSAFQSLLQNRVVIANGYTSLGGVVSQAVSLACPTTGPPGVPSLGIQNWGKCFKWYVNLKTFFKSVKSHVLILYSAAINFKNGGILLVVVWFRGRFVWR